MRSLLIAQVGELQTAIAAALSAAGAGEALQAKDLPAARALLGREEVGVVLLVCAKCGKQELDFLQDCGEKGVACALLTSPAETRRAEEQLLRTRCLVLCAPLSRKELELFVRLALCVSRKFTALQEQNEQLRRRLEDFKVIDRAKCCLVAILGMDEERAHRYIQKRAMDMRVSQREIAEDILKTYE